MIALGLIACFVVGVAVGAVLAAIAIKGAWSGPVGTRSWEDDE